MWSEKYRPQNISDMIGNEESRSLIIEWFTKWKKGTKPLLLVGPPGIGKTAGIARGERSGNAAEGPWSKTRRWKPRKP